MGDKIAKVEDVLGTGDTMDIPDSEITRAQIKIDHDDGIFRADDIAVLDSDGDPTDKIVVIPVFAHYSRSLTTDPEEDTFKVLCKSADFKNGVGDPGGRCATCVEEKWVDDKKPACKRTVELYCVIKNAENKYVSYVFYARSTAYTVINGFINGYKNAGKYLFDNLLTIDLEQKSFGKTKKKYYVPELTPGMSVPDDERMIIAQEIVMPLKTEIDARKAGETTDFGDPDGLD